jgi:hypothetical protein
MNLGDGDIEDDVFGGSVSIQVLAIDGPHGTHEPSFSIANLARLPSGQVGYINLWLFGSPGVKCQARAVGRKARPPDNGRV